MPTWRSPRAIVAAALAAVVAYAFVAVRGAPAPLAWLASIGGSSVDARGGVVLDVHFDGGDKAMLRVTERVLAARLQALGATVSFEQIAPATVRFSAAGLLPERAEMAAAALRMRGRIALRPVVVDGAPLDAIAHLRDQLAGTGVTVDTDGWSTPDGSQRTVPYLRAPDRDSLQKVVRAQLAASGAEIAIEEVTPHARYRTYVLGPDTIVGNDDLAGAEATPDPNTERAVVMLTFTPAGGQRFGDWTASHVGDKLAIVVDGEVRSAPVINGAIRGGKAMLTMGAAAGDGWAAARALAAALAAREPLFVEHDVRVVGTFEPSPLAAHLARLLAALLAALLSLAIAWGLGRVGGLEAAPPARAASDASTGPIRWAELARRAAITIAVPVALVVVRGVWVPGVDHDALAAQAAHGRDLTAWASVGMLGVVPILTAYVLAELVALAIPAWRARRHAGRDARVPLVAAAAALAAALTIVQAWLVASYLAWVPTEPFGEVDRWAVVAGLSAGVLAQALGAAAISRWGAGSGWSVLLAASYLEPIVRSIVGGHAHAAPLALWLGQGALVAWIAIAATRARVRDDGGAAIRLPLGGVAAVTIAPAVTLAITGVLTFLPPFAFVYRGLELLAWLSQPIAQLIAAPLLGLGLGALWSRRLRGRGRAAALLLSGAIATAIGSLQQLLSLAQVSAPGLGAALAAAATIDLAIELRARARGAWIERDQLHDVDAADAAIAAPGPDRFARGLHVRALLRFFAPFVPITIFERR